MKIIIERILSNKLICFSSEFGKGIASWGDIEPQLKEYDVEFDIEDSLIWDQSIKKSNQKNPSISTNEYTNTFIGILESIDEDGYSVLRMGNSVTPFYANGNAFAKDIMIEIKIKNLVMSPYDIV